MLDLDAIQARWLEQLEDSALIHLMDHRTIARDVVVLITEVERLREYWGDTLGLVMEVERLRAALEEIARQPHGVKGMVARIQVSRARER